MRKLVAEGKKVTIADAEAYLSTMRYRFAVSRETEKYDKFVKLLHDVNHKRISKSVFMKMAKETVLKGHNDLLIDFLAFCPKGFEITVPTPILKDAEHFNEKVKNRDSRVHQSFLNILYESKKEKTPTVQVYQQFTYQFARLFYNHPDLLREFAQFVPYGIDIPSANQLQLHLQQEEITSSTVVDSLPAEYQSASEDEGSCVLD